jgi:hypothetical protein
MNPERIGGYLFHNYLARETAGHTGFTQPQVQLPKPFVAPRFSMFG